MWQTWRRRSIAVWRRASDDGVGDYAASLSYRMLLAMFPFAIFLAAAGAMLAGMFGTANPTERIVNEFGSALPENARPLVEDQLRSILETRSGSLLSFGILGAIWSASAGVAASIRAMNLAYDAPEGRPYWKRTLLAVGLTVSSASFLMASFALIVAGEALARSLVSVLGLGEAFGLLTRLTQFVLVAAMLLVTVAILYWAAPAGHRPLQWVTPGAVMFVIGWLAASVGFAQYVSRFGSYEATYGTLGGVIVLMLWLYITAYLLLLGAELNGVLSREQQEEQARAQPPSLPQHAVVQRGPARSSGAPASRHPAQSLASSPRGRRAFARTRLGQLTGLVVAGATVVRATRKGDDAPGAYAGHGTRERVDTSDQPRGLRTARED